MKEWEILFRYEVTKEHSFNAFFGCLCLNSLQPQLGYCWVGNFIFQSSLRGCESGWDSVKIQTGIGNHYSVLPNSTTPAALRKWPGSCAVQQLFRPQRKNHQSRLSWQVSVLSPWLDEIHMGPLSYGLIF